MKYQYEGEAYEVTVEGVGCTTGIRSGDASDLIAGEPSLLLMDIGGWTVDMMRLDNGSASAPAEPERHDRCLTKRKVLRTPF
ncbi:MAG: hypothetical protein ACLRI7_11120 [Ruthenibacterium lactatiformans]